MEREYKYISLNEILGASVGLAIVVSAYVCGMTWHQDYKDKLDSKTVYHTNNIERIVK